MDSAGGHRRSGNSARTMVNESADRVPAPSPCTARPASRAGIDGAMAQIAAPTAKPPSARR